MTQAERYRTFLRERHELARAFRQELQERLARASGDEGDRFEERIREVEIEIGILAGRKAEAEAQA
jgi:hypothetical protein